MILGCSRPCGVRRGGGVEPPDCGPPGPRYDSSLRRMGDRHIVLIMTDDAGRRAQRRGAMTIGALAGCALAVLSVVVLGEGQAIRRSDAKVYRILGDTKHLPKLD